MHNLKVADYSDWVEGVDYNRTALGTIVKTDEYELTYEIVDDNFMLHMDVHKYTLSLYKEMKKDWEAVRAFLYNEGWPVLLTYASSEKTQKFIRKFGGEEIGSVEDVDGTIYGVFRWQW